jgi:hypothetical protein
MAIFARLLTVLLITMVIVQCKPKTIPNNTEVKPPVDKSVEPEKGAVIVEENAPVLLPVGIEPDLVASIRRTPCFGSCPVYEIKLFRDGSVHYTGKKNVAMIGQYRASADRTFMEQIMRKAQELKYFDFQERYPASGMISDLPLTITYFRQGGSFKLINDYFDSPKDLQLFEKFLDEMFSKLEYKPLD